MKQDGYYYYPALQVLDYPLHTAAVQMHRRVPRDIGVFCGSFVSTGIFHEDLAILSEPESSQPMNSNFSPHVLNMAAAKSAF